MAASTAVTQSMQRITTTKLEALAKQHAMYEATKTKILNEIDKEMVVSERVRILLDRLEEHKVTMPTSFSTKVMRAFLDQSKYDPSVSPALLESWEADLKKSLDIPSRKYQHASLFGQLAMEWLQSGIASSPSHELGDSFETVGRKEMHDQRKEWENLVFTPRAEPDTNAISSYLERLFNCSTEAQRGLKDFRKRTAEFELQQLTTDLVKLTIKHLISADLLSPEKQAALKDLRDNSLVLSEMADVLNMQIDSLKSWSWGPEPVPLDVRRGLNGKYRVFMDEELLTAILLEYIGVQWAVFFKGQFLQFMGSGTWKQSATSANEHTESRSSRRRTLKPRGTDGGVKQKQWATYQADYFMQQLPSSLSENMPSYGEDGADSESTWNGKETKSFTTKKQELFHLIATEALVTSQLHGSWTILQSDFRWFGPSLPHATILTVLKFFGIGKTWLNFFEKYLQPPLRFAQDGPNAPSFTRKSGVPISHALTEVMGEAVLFCLDFAVNSNSQGNLYRVHDDIWFWGSKEGSIAAWNTLNKFTDVMGLQLNEEKTGSAHVVRGTSKPTIIRDLPPNPVKWGFLILDPSGRWQMNQEQVRLHTQELKLQLSACKSIFAWIQAWNTYVARFLATNFGEPAQCLGKAHVDMVIQTFKSIQEDLFSSNDSSKDANNVTNYLKSQLHSRFDLPDIPDGLLFFPLELGGLGLSSPLIPLMLVRNKALDDPTTRITDALEQEEMEYNRLRQDYDNGEEYGTIRELLDHDRNFLSLEEVMKQVEASSKHLGNVYEELMEKPEELNVEFGPEVNTAMEELPVSVRKKWISDPYWRWVIQLYGGEIVREFGGLALGDKRLLPIGLTSMLREQRIKWQG